MMKNLVGPGMFTTVVVVMMTYHVWNIETLRKREILTEFVIKKMPSGNIPLSVRIKVVYVDLAENRQHRQHDLLSQLLYKLISAQTAQSKLYNQFLPSDFIVLGLDCEWRPSGSKKSVTRSVTRFTIF